MTGVLREVPQNAAGIRAFSAVPFELRRRGYEVAPRLRTVERRRLSKKHPSSRLQEIRMWIAASARGTEGRIAAALDSRVSATAPSGFVGFFESTGDPVTCRAMFDVATNWLRERGAAEIKGPSSFTPNDECGLLVSGYEEHPTFGATWNRSGYVDLWENDGRWEKECDLLGYKLTRAIAPSERQERAASFAEHRLGVSVGPIAPSELGDLMRTFLDRPDTPWEQTWGHWPMTGPEIFEIGKQLSRISDPELALVARAQTGEAIGIAVAVPDLNLGIVRASNGRLVPLGWMQMAGALRRGSVFRVVAFGVHQRFDGKGVGPLLLREIHRRATRREWIHYGEASWTAETNSKMRAALEALGASEYKRWRVYRWKGVVDE